MITEDYVSFEIAKLLKEKGFDEPTTKSYYTEGFENPMIFSHDLLPCIQTGEFLCPTIQMAMKWLREVYGLFIRITEDITGNIFEWSVYQKNYGCKASTYVEDSYEQACETAIKYCLENLI